MNEATAKLLAEKAAVIAKETAELLKHFDRETGMLIYAKQMVENDIKGSSFPEGTEHKKMSNKDANQKLAKMLEEAKLKWKYADDIAKKKVTQMEMIVLAGQEKIRGVYAGVIAEAVAMGKKLN